MSETKVVVEYPAWVDDVVNWGAPLPRDEDRMRLAIALARENVARGTGGPFGAVIVERESGRLVSVGVNSVVRLHNCTLHGEMVAIMMAQQRLRSYTLAAPEMPAHDLFTSCEPCAMCLGATLWSGVGRLVCGASREDATQLSFDEGPVFEQSYHYLQERGIEVVRELLRAEARDVLVRYGESGGPIYNA